MGRPAQPAPAPRQPQPVPGVQGLTGLVINGVVHLIIAINTTGWHTYCGINPGLTFRNKEGAVHAVRSSPRCRKCYPIITADGSDQQPPGSPAPGA